MAQIKQNLIYRIKIKTVLILVFLALFSHVIVANAKESDITPTAVIKLVNEARKEAGVNPLIENTKLKAAANAKASDMFKYEYFAHVSPQGKSPWDLIMEQKYDYRYAGENLAIDYTDAKEQQQAWMDSELHRKNILNSDYKEIGVATESGTFEGRKTIITVQEFGTQVLKQSQVPASTQEVLPSKKAVAGSFAKENDNKNSLNPVASFGELEKEVSEQMELGKIFEENKLTLAGWLLAVSLAILITISDAVIVLYRKHRHL